MMNAELFTLTYGAIVRQLLTDLEEVEEVNEQLDQMGYNIGIRLIDEFLAKSNVSRCNDFRETTDVIAKELGRPDPTLPGYISIKCCPTPHPTLPSPLRLSLTSAATRKNKADPGWKYCHSLVEGDTNTIVCNFCGKITKGGITRAKQHLIGKSGNVAACKKTPPNVVEELKEYMATKKSGTTYSTSGSGNMANIRDFEFGEPIGCDGSEEDEFADSCNAAASAKTKCGTKKGPMDKFCKNPENAINRRKMEMLRQMNIRESMDKNEVLKVHQHIARFWYQAGLSFNLIKLKSFENMVAAIGQYGPHLPIPSYHDIRVPLLKKEVEYTENLMKGHREQWVKYGCTIMSDAWTDRKQRCIINFLINSQAGTMFLKSVDGSDFVKTGEKLFELLDAIVEEVGEENVVQVVTDNGSNYVLAGKLLEEKRKHIYWTPCAAHCIDLMLEDIGKLPLIRKTIRRAINLVGFIYAHSSTLSLLRNFTNKRELVRHAITRFATSYLTLERLHKEKANIRKMFTSDEWTLNKLSKEPKGKEAAKVVLMPSFWNSVVYTLKVMAPLVKVLRLVDGERKPAMGYIYEAMDKAKETIMKSFNNNESKYKDVFEIIDKRWNCQLHRPLHAAAHFLNPEFFYDNTDLEFDFEVTNGLFECIKKLIPQFDVQQKILTELHLYKIGADHFGSDFAMAQRKTHSPTYWWRMFGSQTPNLQKLAIKILSLTCSASGCERNWSVFEQIHSKKRNRLEHKRLHDLVFVKYNQQLKQRYNARDEIDPISLNDIDVCNEWLVGEMDQDDDNDAGNDLVFEDDDALNWATVYQASGVGECRMYTRRKKQKTSVAAAQTSKKQAMVVGSSSRKQKAVQENDEDLDVEENIDVESEEEEIMVNFEASDGEEGEGDAPLPYDNNEDDYNLNLHFALCIMFLSFSYFELFNEFIWCWYLIIVGFKMFLGVTASVTNWDADGTCCSIVLEDNPLVDFVELPDNCQGLYYCNILSGVIRGALDMVSMKTEVTWLRDVLRGDDVFELQVKLLKHVPEEYPYKDDE
ncbi:Trafficking protein particle complex subunit 3 [Glycine soja]